MSPVPVVFEKKTRASYGWLPHCRAANVTVVPDQTPTRHFYAQSRPIKIT